MHAAQHLSALFSFALIALAIPHRAVGETIVINGRTTIVNASTLIELNGQAIQASALPVLRGMKVDMISSPSRGGAIAATLRFDVGIIGPITGTQPLRVLGQELTVTADAVVINASNVSALVLGQSVAASGHIDPAGSMLATQIVRQIDPLTQWRLTGFVSTTNTAAQEFTVGTQRISYANVTPIDCGSAPSVGQFVDLRANAMANFTPNSAITTLTRMSCGTAVAFGTPGAAGALEGIVEALISATQFKLGGLTINHDAATTFQFGTVDDLDLGVRIEMEGSFVTPSQYNAIAIALIRPPLRITAPVAAAQITAGQQITALNKVVRKSAQLRDEDLIQSNGLSAPRQVEIRGYVDRAGGLWSTRIRDRGNVNANDVRLRGQVANIAAPLLTVLGLQMDTSACTFTGIQGEPLTAAQFFAQLSVGALVNLSGASFNSVTNRLSGGTLSLIAPDGPPLATPLARQVGTTGFSDFGAFQFGDGFEGLQP